MKRWRLLTGAHEVDDGTRVENAAGQWPSRVVYAGGRPYDS